MSDKIEIKHIGHIHELFDPRYIRISREAAMMILDMSYKTFVRREASDPKFPVGTRSVQSRAAKRHYVLQEVYNYSAYLTHKEFEEEQEFNANKQTEDKTK